MPSSNGCRKTNPYAMAALASADRIRAACLDPVRTVVRPDGWKFNYSPLGEHELYNLRDDPGETQNRFEHERHGSLVRELAAGIRAWQDRTQDTVQLPAL